MKTLRNSRIVLALALLAVVLLGPSGGDVQAGNEHRVGKTPLYAPPVGPEITLASRGSAMAAAYNSVHDEYLVVWVYNSDILARRISSRGDLLSAAYWIAYGSYMEVDPSVDYDPVNDRYLVVWSEELPSGDWDIYGRFIPWNLLTSNLTKFAIADDTKDPRPELRPKVVYAFAQQEFFVVWENLKSGSQYHISGRRVFADGSGFPALPFAVARLMSEDRNLSDVAYNLARNEYLVTYTDWGSGGDDQTIYGTRLAGNGTVLGGGEFEIAGWPDSEGHPSVAACHASDQYLVTWISQRYMPEHNSLYTRFINGDGSLAGVISSDYTNLGIPVSGTDVACQGGAKYMLAWESWYSLSCLKGRLVYPNETLDEIFIIQSPNPAPNPYDVVVACGSPNCLVAYDYEDKGGNYAIHGRIVGNTKPKSAFTVNPTMGTTDTIFNFDPSSTSDAENLDPLLRVRWDWEGDGTYDTAWTWGADETTNHTFPATGIYNVRLEVQDHDGLTDSTTRQVVVAAPLTGNIPPTATFTVNPPRGEVTTVFDFDASGCSDSEDPNPVLQVRWDWNNDGIFETDWNTIKTAAHSFITGGIHTVRLDVKDSGDLTDATTHQVDVAVPATANLPPAAFFTLDPTSGDTTTVFNFDASDCSDAEDPPSALQVRWDWDNDGVFETEWSTTKTATHSFAADGTHTVLLEVKDTGGLTDAIMRQISIGAQTAPQMLFLPMVMR